MLNHLHDDHALPARPHRNAHPVNSRDLGRSVAAPGAASPVCCRAAQRRRSNVQSHCRFTKSHGLLTDQANNLQLCGRLTAPDAAFAFAVGRAAGAKSAANPSSHDVTDLGSK